MAADGVCWVGCSPSLASRGCGRPRERLSVESAQQCEVGRGEWVAKKKQRGSDVSGGGGQVDTQFCFLNSRLYFIAGQ